MNLLLLILSHVWVFLWHLFCDSRWNLQSWCSSTDRFKIKTEFWKFLSCWLSFSWSWRGNRGCSFASAPGMSPGWEAKTQGWLMRYRWRPTAGAGQLRPARTHLNKLQLPESSQCQWAGLKVLKLCDSPLWAGVQLAQGSITMDLGYILDYLNFPCPGKHNRRMFSYSQNIRAYSWQIESFWNKKIGFLNRMPNHFVAWL